MNTTLPFYETTAEIDGRVAVRARRHELHAAIRELDRRIAWAEHYDEGEDAILELAVERFDRVTELRQIEPDTSVR